MEQPHLQKTPRSLGVFFQLNASFSLSKNDFFFSYWLPMTVPSNWRNSSFCWLVSFLGISTTALTYRSPLPPPRRWVTPSPRVIEGGVLKTLLYNLKTAAVAGKQTTGNASKAGYVTLILI